MGTLVWATPLMTHLPLWLSATPGEWWRWCSRADRNSEGLMEEGEVAEIEDACEGDYVPFALLRALGAYADEPGAGKRLLKRINQIYPTWLLHGSFWEEGFKGMNHREKKDQQINNPINVTKSAVDVLTEKHWSVVFGWAKPVLPVRLTKRHQSVWYFKHEWVGELSQWWIEVAYLRPTQRPDQCLTF